MIAINRSERGSRVTVFVLTMYAKEEVILSREILELVRNQPDGKIIHQRDFYRSSKVILLRRQFN